MIPHDTVPLVLPNDDGLRTQEPGRCFYCHQPIGQPHRKTCVCVFAHVRYRVSATLPCGKRFGTFTTYDPWAWFEDGSDPETEGFAGHWRFARNDGSWCADNADVKWVDADTERLLNLAIGDGCSCKFLEFKLAEVLDKRYHTRPGQ